MRTYRILYKGEWSNEKIVLEATSAKIEELPSAGRRLYWVFRKDGLAIAWIDANEVIAVIDVTPSA